MYLVHKIQQDMNKNKAQFMHQWNIYIVNTEKTQEHKSAATSKYTNSINAVPWTQIRLCSIV